MFLEREFEFGTQWQPGVRTSNDAFWIALNQHKTMGRTQYSGSGLLVTRECETIEELESEVARLKNDLDHALADARQQLSDVRR